MCTATHSHNQQKQTMRRSTHRTLDGPAASGAASTAVVVDSQWLQCSPLDDDAGAAGSPMPVCALVTATVGKCAGEATLKQQVRCVSLARGGVKTAVQASTTSSSNSSTDIPAAVRFLLGFGGAYQPLRAPSWSLMQAIARAAPAACQPAVKSEYSKYTAAFVTAIAADPKAATPHEQELLTVRDTQHKHHNTSCHNAYRAIATLAGLAGH